MSSTDSLCKQCQPRSGATKYSDSIPEKIFKENIFFKIQQMTKKHENYPGGKELVFPLSVQAVNEKVCRNFFCCNTEVLILFKTSRFALCLIAREII